MVGDSQLLDFAHFFDKSGEEGSDWDVVVGCKYMLRFKRVGSEEESEGGGFKNVVKFEVRSTGKCMEITYRGFGECRFCSSGD